MKKIISIILLCSLLLTMLLAGTSCKDEATEIKDNTQNQTDEQNNTQPEETTEYIEAIDGGGKDFVILNRDVSEVYNAHPYAEFTAENETGDPINDAIYHRNRFIEEKYNIKIISATPTLDVVDMGNSIKRAHDAGDETYQIASLALNQCFKLAYQGYIHDLNGIPHIDISKPWWMTSMAKASSIKGKNYYISGDMNLGAFNTATCIFFTKQPLQDLSLENPYTLVKEGKWTLDKLSEMCKAVTNDINGDSKIDHEDKVGITTSSFAWQVFFYGADSLFVKKDENDIPSFLPLDERTYNVLSKVFDAVNNPVTSLNLAQITGIDLLKVQTNMFEENRSLFMINNIYGTIPARAMNTDLGILPVPKYDESQKDYVSSLHGNNATAMCVPTINNNTDLAGRILEDMTYMSNKIVRPAYYDITLKIKFAQDEESPKMLDLIFNKLIIDPVLLMWDGGQGVDGLLRTAMIENNKNFVSQIEANIDSYNATINGFVEMFIEK